jgi:esterase/lipase
MDLNALYGLAVVGLLVILALFLIPVATTHLEAHPDPCPDYDAAVERFAAMTAEEAATCFPKGRSLLLTHGHRTSRAYVLIHGMTNSPHQFEEFGRLLWERGYNVIIPRLPYHGLQSRRLRELRPLRAEHLRDFADTAVDLAAGLGEEVVVIGVSAGAAVAAWPVQFRLEARQAILIAPFMGAHGLPRFVTTLLMNACTRLPSIDLQNPKEPARDWVYRGQTTRPLAETVRLSRAVFRQAAKAPPMAGQILILTTAGDVQVDNSETAKLAALWQRSGAAVTQHEFDPALAMPHNPIDPAADPEKRACAYEYMLRFLGEPITST